VDALAERINLGDNDSEEPEHILRCWFKRWLPMIWLEIELSEGVLPACDSARQIGALKIVIQSLPVRERLNAAASGRSRTRNRSCIVASVL
jgi:hypothetical protein